MRLPRWTYSLKWRIVASYSLILIVGGVSTSFIGIRVTGNALLRQARHQVDHGLSAARTIYLNRLNELRFCVELVVTSRRVREAIVDARQTGGGAGVASARKLLTSTRERSRLDFLSVAELTGTVVLRTAGPGTVGDDVGGLAPLAQALAGRPAASAELVPLAILQAEDPALAERVRVELVQAPEAGPPSVIRLDAGMVLLAAAPVRDEAGRVVGIVYAGQLLNESAADADSARGYVLVDQMKDTLFPGLRSEDRDVGAATIFQDDARITTTVTAADGRRAGDARFT